MSPTDLIKRLLPTSGKATDKAPEPSARSAPHDSAGQARLIAIARSDAEPGARADAVKRLTDLDTLQACLAPATPAPVRMAAVARLSLLLKSDDPGLAPQERVAAVRHCPDTTVLAHLAQSARLEAVRRAALDRLRTPAACLQAALHDPVRRQRKFAVECVDHLETLEAIAAQSDDRGVARLARRRLQALRDEQAEQQAVQTQAVGLCEAMEALASAPWRDDLPARRQRLENQWRQLDPTPPPALADRFARAQGHCAARRAPQAGDREARLLNALEEEARALTHHPEPEEARLRQLRESLARTRREWLHLGADPATEARFRTRYWRLECWCADARRLLDQQRIIEQLLSEADALPLTEAPPLLRHARQLQQALRQAPWHSGFPLPRLLREGQATVKALERTARHAGQTRVKRLQALHHLMASLEQAIEERAWGRARRLISEALRETGERPAGPAGDQRKR
ncbi:hypothetical protein ACN2MM_07025 [Alkalilimnicola ehrlichii MLHE-1]|uniref:DUF349 domain-containing protein n=1 Tax=Alkalilimnicola ehrlichii (strain ATCC BAA-1101 / DSM 17681 / MLHE-1) TaxID=187272 RepID=Q0A964_ALKEH|nr:hypothetical protein [Alkalilimnicola ehrlichii]ABI56623.1 hypothetical protein Mlg_1274 [Alkalilimnicola ehrlichii MLHE-1]